MATDVSYLSRILNGGGGDTTDSGEPIATRDLLGGNFSTVLDSSNKELDLDLHVPSGFEKRLDLKSGNVYIQKWDSTKSSSSSKSEDNKVNDTVSKLQDLNFPPSARSNIPDETNVELKLMPASSATPAASSSTTTVYSVCTLDKVKSALERMDSVCTLDKVKSALERMDSVCTLDKVKSALERMEKKSNHMKRRSVSVSSSPPSHSSSSVKDRGELMEEEDKSSASRAATYAGGCPNCLLYVLVSKNDPKCPRCYVTVPSPTAFKKPRIDLNISLC